MIDLRDRMLPADRVVEALGLLPDPDWRPTPRG